MLDAIYTRLKERATARETKARAEGFGLLYYAFSNGMATRTAEDMLRNTFPNSAEGKAFFEGSVEAVRHWKEFQALKGSQK